MHKGLSPGKGGVYDGKNILRNGGFPDFQKQGSPVVGRCAGGLRRVLWHYVRIFKVDSSNHGKGGIMNNGIKKETQMLEHRRPQAVKRNYIIANGCSFVNNEF